MRVPGVKHLRMAGRWLSSRKVNGALILGYHRIAENPNDVYSVCVRPQHFAEQMASLRQHANPVPLDALISSLQRDMLPPRAVVVTFDDGYADNLYQAMPLFTQYEIPVSLFVATGYLGRQFWWDELDYLVLKSPNLPAELVLEAGNKVHTWQLSNDYKEDRNSLLREIYQWMLDLSAGVCQQIIGQLSQQIDSTYDQAGTRRALTAEELNEFSRNDLVTIGAHSVTHPFLARLPEEAQCQEIEQSKRDLQAILGQPVNAFSYPNGSSNETTRTLLREAGFRSACASYNDVADPSTDLFNLPRFWVPDQNGSKFASWLRRWLPN